MTDQRVEDIAKKIGTFLDFPKPGVVFKDIFTVLADPLVFQDLINVLQERIKALCPDVEVIMGLDSRGFLFGTPLALAFGLPFVPVRKKGKLPGEVTQVTYSLEYGEDVFEAKANSLRPGQKVLIVDDLLATGGSMKAACDLVAALDGQVSLCLVCIELADLKGREKLQAPCESIVRF